MDNELKPCPFCGAAPRVTERPSTAGEGGGFSCFIACYCGGYSARAHHMGDGNTPEEARTKAAAAWNRRAVPDGWRLVPVHPTREMLYALGDCRARGAYAWTNSEAWAAILAAAPYPENNK